MILFREPDSACLVFRYGYAVQDDIGNDFNKQETSDGGVVTGQYSVLLPDGRIQTVTYSVAPNTGFVVSAVEYCSVYDILYNHFTKILRLKLPTRKLILSSQETHSDKTILLKQQNSSTCLMSNLFVFIINEKTFSRL